MDPPLSTQPTVPPLRSIYRQSAAPRRRHIETSRRNRGATSFDRAARVFVAVEQRRLQLQKIRDRRMQEREIERDRRLHEYEVARQRLDTERLKLDAESIYVARQQNRLLSQLCTIAEAAIQVLSQRQNSTPTPVVVPDTERKEDGQ